MKRSQSILRHLGRNVSYQRGTQSISSSTTTSALGTATFAEGLPSRMKAVIHGTDQPKGELGKLRDDELPLPEIQPHEVLIKVRATGVNRPDVLQRRGLYPAPSSHSSLLGLEVAGDIVGVGSQAASMAPQKVIHNLFQSQFLQHHGLDRKRGGDLPLDLSLAADRGFLGSPIGWEVGTPVVALLNGGGYAEYVAVPASQVLPQPNMSGQGIVNPFEDVDVPLVNAKPDNNVVETAAIPESFFTVWHNLIYTAGLQPGEICLIHGALSGIGSTAIQIAKACGAHVITTAGSPEKCEAAIRLGATVAIDYNTADFSSVLKESPFKNWLSRKVHLPEIESGDLPSGVYLNPASQTNNTDVVKRGPLETVALSSRTWGASTCFHSDTAPLPSILPRHCNSHLLNRLSLINLERKLHGDHRDRTALKQTPGDGVDVVLDMIGGDYIPGNMGVLGTCGRLVNVAFLKGSKVGSTSGTSIDFTRMMLKRLTLTGSTLRSRSDSAKAGLALDLYTYVWPHLQSLPSSQIIGDSSFVATRDQLGPLMDVGPAGTINDAAYPLTAEGVQAAHERMESSQHYGKLVLYCV
eukprot:gb/GECG01005799.1/.p1 GENE.gb/GECG01005799.1/~~gb/GECG01005799.1/.p1  ORF type:complete len:580 (+),score=46.84 gb/GECG01005799.1/:1-1740(+)